MDAGCGGLPDSTEWRWQDACERDNDSQNQPRWRKKTGDPMAGFPPGARAEHSSTRHLARRKLSTDCPTKNPIRAGAASCHAKALRERFLHQMANPMGWIAANGWALDCRIQDRSAGTSAPMRPIWLLPARQGGAARRVVCIRCRNLSLLMPEAVRGNRDQQACHAVVRWSAILAL